MCSDRLVTFSMLELNRETEGRAAIKGNPLRLHFLQSLFSPPAKNPIWDNWCTRSRSSQDQGIISRRSYDGFYIIIIFSTPSLFCPKQSSEQLQLYFIDVVPICSPSQSLGSHRKKIKHMPHPLPLPGIGQLCHDVGFCVTVSTPNDSTISPPHKTIVDVWTTHRTSLIIKWHTGTWLMRYV